jgi:spore germination protein (amino acid permease)
MEKQSFISNKQLIVLLILTRLPFSTAYIVGLNAGRSVQDILLAVPVNFVINFIVAIPLLMLIKRYPGKDPVECAINILGKPTGMIVALIYGLFFLATVVHMQAVFQNFFINTVIPDSNFNSVAIPMLFVVCFYGAVKGIETIVRFSSIGIVIYLVVVSMIIISLIPSIKLDYLSPQFYNGPGVFLKAIWAGFNSNPQILFLAFCIPFLKIGTKTGKLFMKWNIFAMVLFFLLEFVSITVMGPYGAKQNYPLSALSMLSQISVFERLDAIDMVSWILNAVIYTTFYIYLMSSCILKFGFNKHKKIVIFLCVVVIFFLSKLEDSVSTEIHDVYTNPILTGVTVFLLIVLPITLLLADVIKRRIVNEETE